MITKSGVKESSLMRKYEMMLQVLKNVDAHNEGFEGFDQLPQLLAAQIKHAIHEASKIGSDE